MIGNLHLHLHGVPLSPPRCIASTGSVRVPERLDERRALKAVHRDAMAGDGAGTIHNGVCNSATERLLRVPTKPDPNRTRINRQLNRRYAGPHPKGLAMIYYGGL